MVLYNVVSRIKYSRLHVMGEVKDDLGRLLFFFHAAINNDYETNPVNFSLVLSRIQAK